MSDYATAFRRDAEQQAAGRLAARDGHGVHRTATAGDDAGVRWLAAKARALGASVSTEEFALDRLDPITTFLEIGGERIEGVPVFNAPATDEAGVVGRLGAAGEGEIAVAELSARAVYTGWRDPRSSPRWRPLSGDQWHQPVVSSAAGPLA
ncbi:MAG TPA: hypothetical protein VJ770_25410 [Stellaceae bacterium]|nr:hypothetical protein [Stellaceae bacterium]